MQVAELIWTGVLLLGIIAWPAQAQFDRTAIQQVVTEVEATCIFPINHLYLRRVAFVETADGDDPRLVAGEDYGGPWRVTEEMLAATQVGSALITNDQYVALIQQTWGIRWDRVTFSDLSDPLTSALGCMLYTMLNDEFDAIPSQMVDQASYYVTNYRTDADSQRYLTYSQALDGYCVQTLDLVLVIDESLAWNNEILVKYYLTTVVNAFTIGPGNTRIGILKFGNDVDSDVTEVVLPLNNTLDNGGVISVIQGMTFTRGNQTLHRGLEDLREVMFQEDAGARPFTPLRNRRSALLFTNGISTDPDEAEAQAALNQAALITTFVAFSEDEGFDPLALSTIATPPSCRNVDVITNFPDASFFRYVLNNDGCVTPTAFEYCCQNLQVPAGTSNFLMVFGEKGATVSLRSDTDDVTFLLSSDRYPTIIDFEYALISDENIVAGAYIPFPNVPDFQRFAFGSFVASSDTGVFICFHALVDDSV